jgi:integrase
LRLAACSPSTPSPHSVDADFVFASSAGTPLGHRNIVRRGLELTLAKAGLPALTWHDLRHLAASALIAEGASVAYVSRVLGHANPSGPLSRRPLTRTLSRERDCGGLHGPPPLPPGL